MRFIRTLLTLIALATGLVSVSHASDARPSYWLGDWPSDVSLAEFTELENDRLNLGFSDRPVWLFLPKKWAGELNAPWFHLTPQHIDRAEVFPSLTDKSPVLVFGDSVQASDAVYAEAYGYGFSLLEVLGEDGVYIRLTSDNAFYINFETLSERDFFNRSRSHLLNISLVLGIGLFYMAWSLVQWFVMRDFLAVWYMARQILFSSALFVHSGLSQAQLGESQNDVHNWLAIVYILVAQIFDYQLLRRYKIPRLLDGSILLIIALFPVKAVLLYLGETTAALVLNNMTIVAELVLVLIASCVAKQQSANETTISRVWLIWFYGIQCLTPVTLVVFAFLEQSFDITWLGYATVWYGAVHGAIILGMLSKYFKNSVLERERLAHSIDKLALTAKLEREKSEEVSDLISMLGHELKTPIATMKFALSSSGKASEKLLQRSMNNITQVIDQCVQLDELGRASLVVQPETFDLSDLVKGAAIGHIEFGHVERGLVEADSVLTGSIISNLLANAGKYGVGAAVLIEVRVVDQEVELVVSNEVASGIELTQDIFKKYYRHPSSRRSTGTGLGLYLSRRFAEKMGGSLLFEQKGNRVLFSLYLPRASDQLEFKSASAVVNSGVD